MENLRFVLLQKNQQSFYFTTEKINKVFILHLLYYL